MTALRRLVLGAFVVLVSGAGLCGAAIADTAAIPVKIDASDADGHGRIVLTFTDRMLLPGYSSKVANGVLSVSFADPVVAQLDTATLALTKYISVARQDSDGHGLRFALLRGVKVNVLEAGPQLYIDFLPANWQGMLPSLPADVVSALARKAEEAIQKQREAEQRNGGRTIVPMVDFKYGQSPTFSRYYFGWNVPFDTKMTREAESVKILFNRMGDLDLSEVKANLPPYVTSIDSSVQDGQLQVLFRVQTKADVRTFRDGDAYVVDVVAPVSKEADSKAIALLNHVIMPDAPPPTATNFASAPGSTDAVSSPPAPASVPSAPMAAAKPSQPAVAVAPSAAAPVPAATPAPVAAMATEKPVPGAAGPASAAAAVPSPAPAAGPSGSSAQTAGTTVGPDVTAQPALAGNMTAETGKVANTVDPFIRAVAERVGSSMRLVFPFSHPVKAAAFQRGTVLWLLFDDPSPIELAEVRSILVNSISGLSDITGSNYRALRIDLSAPLFTSVEHSGDNWIVTLGDSIIAPSRPLQVQRAIASSGSRMLQVPFGDDGHVFDVIDPVVGDHLAVVAGDAPVRGLAKPQTLTDVDILPSVQGVAFVPKSDSVAVSISDGLVMVSQPDGLNLSEGVARTGAAVPLSQRLGADRAGVLDIGGYGANDPNAFQLRRSQLFSRIERAQNPQERMVAWYDMAKFYVANQLGAEAEGALSLIQGIDGGEVDKARFITLQGASQILLGRNDDGMKLLSQDVVKATPDASLWRVIGATALRDYNEARRSYPAADRVAGTYPADLQARVLLDAARAEIELHDLGNASTLLAQVDMSRVDRGQYALIDLLGARIADAAGRTGDAVEFLNHAVQIGRGPVAAEATYRLVQLEQREGLITPGQAADRLEHLEVAWRGDEIELMTLKALAEISVDSGNYRRGFEAMRTANLVNPASPLTRALQEEMGAAFASLFLDGAGAKLPPIEALALFYDFKDLTPSGPRGDAMVRKLANRLVDVDLLPQATSLLEHQVESRLHGASRAQVAADLAVIYMLDHNPERALMTLSRTRQAELPLEIERQRRVVEARALSDTGKTDIALELLQPLSGLDIERLRADVEWQGKRYRDAGRGYELLLGGRWGDEGSLSDAEQMDVLKAGIAYALAGDDSGRERLHGKYLTKMSGTPSAAAFDVVTGPYTTKGYEFRSVADMVKTSDSIAEFLKVYRKQYSTDSPAVSTGAPLPASPAGGAKPEATAPNANAPRAG